MGSGLILLLIVGAWLAVLVPMALRSHEASVLGTMDKFSDAMRVLSRREVVGAARASGAPPDGEGHEEDASAAPGRLRRLGARFRPGRLRTGSLRSGSLRSGLRRAGALRPGRRRSGRPRRPMTAAARRRRSLLVLLAAAVLTLVGPLTGPIWLLVPHLVVDVLLVVFLCWLRASAVARAERDWRIAMGGRSGQVSDLEPILPAEDASDWAADVAGGTARERDVRPVLARVAGIPDRMPSRDEVDPVVGDLVPEPREADAPARGAQGRPWQPVPLPVPLYVTAPVAPRRRVLGLPRTGAPASSQLGPDTAADAGLEHVMGQRRAVGD